VTDTPEPQTLTLTGGETVIVRPATPDDYPAISALIQDNFAHDESYVNLSEEARTGYMEANSLRGITEACDHPENVVKLVATAADTGAIIGFALYRRSKHLVTGEEVAEGKRVQIARHMKSRSLGEQLLGIVRNQLRSMGFRKTVGYTSGKAASYFEKQGRKPLMTVDNPALAQKGVKAEATYVEYLL